MKFLARFLILNCVPEGPITGERGDLNLVADDVGVVNESASFQTEAEGDLKAPVVVMKELGEETSALLATLLFLDIVMIGWESKANRSGEIDRIEDTSDLATLLGIGLPTPGMPTIECLLGLCLLRGPSGGMLMIEPDDVLR